jgi:hypothetical protein
MITVGRTNLGLPYSAIAADVSLSLNEAWKRSDGQHGNFSVTPITKDTRQRKSSEKSKRRYTNFVRQWKARMRSKYFCRTSKGKLPNFKKTFALP